MQLLNGYIEELILMRLLQDGPTNTTTLLEYVDERCGCTRQGFYRSLRKLRYDEKIAVYRSVVSINELWLRRLRALISPHERGSSILGDISALDAGEKFVLNLRGLSNMDRLWSHAFSIVEQTISPKHPLFLFNPHNWSALLRPETDRVHEQVLREQKRPVYLLVGSTSQLDKIAYQSVGFAHMEVSHNSKVRHEQYIAVLGDYVFEIRFTPTLRRTIHALFQTTDSVHEGRKALLKLDRTAACTVTIERNETKATGWTRRIAQDFYLPKEYR